MHDTYAGYMSQNATETTRVDQQFELLSQNIGYIVHPSILAKLPPTPAVADIGTGTARYLVQLASDHPAADLHGFDISDALFPTRLPHNITLSVLDFKQPFPAEFHNRFDLVHVRYVIASLDEDDWAVVLRNLVQILKPGGAIQWAEPSWDKTEHLRGKPGSTCDGARAMGEMFKQVLSARTPHGWSELPELMQRAGMQRVERDVVSSDRLPETRWALSVNVMVAMCFFAEIMVKQGAIDMSEGDVEALGNQGFLDVDSGCYARYDIHTAIGFKSRSAG